jgi:hypothetical protein
MPEPPPYGESGPGAPLPGASSAYGLPVVVTRLSGLQRLISPENLEVARRYLNDLVQKGPPGWMTWVITLGTLYKLYLDIRKARHYREFRKR